MSKRRWECWQVAKDWHWAETLQKIRWLLVTATCDIVHCTRSKLFLFLLCKLGLSCQSPLVVKATKMFSSDRLHSVWRALRKGLSGEESEERTLLSLWASFLALLPVGFLWRKRSAGDGPEPPLGLDHGDPWAELLRCVVSMKQGFSIFYYLSRHKDNVTFYLFMVFTETGKDSFFSRFTSLPSKYLLRIVNYHCFF